MTDAKQTPITQSPLFAFARGTEETSKAVVTLTAQRKVAKQKGTAVLLAIAKTYPDLQAFIAADTAVRQAACDEYRETHVAAGQDKPDEKPAEAAKAVLNRALCATYLTGCNQMRAAAEKLGWNALMQATTIGALHVKANPPKKGSRTKADDGDTIKTDKEVPETPIGRLMDQVEDALATMPEDKAIALLNGFLAKIGKETAKQAKEQAA